MTMELESFPPQYTTEIDEDSLQAEYAVLQQRQLAIAAQLSVVRRKCGRGQCRPEQKACRGRGRPRFLYLRNAIYNVFVSLPFAIFATLWVILTFYFAAATSIYGLGLVLLPLFVFSWRGLAKFELFTANLVGDKWRPIPDAFPLVVHEGNTSILGKIARTIRDPYTARATVYFMFVKLPFAYMQAWITIGLPWFAFHLAKAAILVLMLGQDIMAMAAANNNNDHPEDFFNGQNAPAGSAGSAGSFGSVGSAGSLGSFSGSMGAFAGSVGSMHSRYNAHQQEIILCIIGWLAVHPAVVVMAFPLAIWIFNLSVIAVTHLGQWQRILVINLFGAPASSPTHIMLSTIADDEKVIPDQLA